MKDSILFTKSKAFALRVVRLYKYLREYKESVIAVGMSLLSSLAWADALSLDAPNLSPYADTESTTNVVFNAGDSDDRLFRLTLELNATADNNVSVVFGTDARTANVECKMGNEECMSEESFYILHSAFSICSSILR